MQGISVYVWPIRASVHSMVSSKNSRLDSIGSLKWSKISRSIFQRDVLLSVYGGGIQWLYSTWQLELLILVPFCTAWPRIVKWLLWSQIEDPSLPFHQHKYMITSAYFCCHYCSDSVRGLVSFVLLALDKMPVFPLVSSSITFSKVAPLLLPGQPLEKETFLHMEQAFLPILSFYNQHYSFQLWMSVLMLPLHWLLQSIRASQALFSALFPLSVADHGAGEDLPTCQIRG